MIKPATILDVNEISEAISMTLGVDGFMYARNSLTIEPWFYKDGLAVQYHIISDHKVIFHFFGIPFKSLRDTRNWIIKTGSWLFDNTPYTCILATAKESDMRLRFLIKNTGAKESCIVENGNGDENEILYIYSKDNRKEYEGRIK